MLAFFSASTSIAPASILRPSFVGGDPNGGNALLPTGQYITPTLAQDSTYQRLSTGLRPDGNADADSAMSSAISPDGKTLLVLTSGFNTGISKQINFPTPSQPFLNANNGIFPQPDPLVFPAIDPLTGKLATLKQSTNLSNGPNQSEFVFVYDVSSGYAVKRQQIELPDSYNGIVWEPSGKRFYVSGGIDDRILIYRNTGAPSTGAPNIAYVPDAPFIILGHNPNDSLPVPTYKGSSLAYTPLAAAFPAFAGSRIGALAATVAGIDISRDGETIVAANFHNASASIVRLTAPRKITDVVFTPNGTLDPSLARGEFPFWVSVKSDPATGAYAKAYVTSQRDDQVVVLTGNAVSAVINVPSGPEKSVLDASQRYLFVACGNDDSVAVIDTRNDKFLGAIPVGIPGYGYKGAIPNSLTLGPSGRFLYVTLGGWNAVAVVDLTRLRVVGRIPTGWLPTSVSVTPDGKHLFVVNEKSIAGPNPGNLYYAWNTVAGASTNPTLRDEYTWELEKSGLISMPTPDPSYLSYLTSVVDDNNNFRFANAQRRSWASCGRRSSTSSISSTRTGRSTKFSATSGTARTERRRSRFSVRTSRRICML